MAHFPTITLLSLLVLSGTPGAPAGRITAQEARQAVSAFEKDETSRLRAPQLEASGRNWIVQSYSGAEFTVDATTGAVWRVLFRRPSDVTPMAHTSNDDARRIAEAYLKSHFPGFAKRDYSVEFPRGGSTITVWMREKLPSNEAYSGNYAMCEVDSKTALLTMVSVHEASLPPEASRPPRVPREGAIRLARTACGISMAEDPATVELKWVGQQAGKPLDRLVWIIVFGANGTVGGFGIIDAQSGAAIEVGRMK